MSKSTANRTHPNELTRKQQLLGEAIEQHWQDLQQMIQVYVIRVIKQSGERVGMTYTRSSIETLAEEILQETIETALKKAEKFDVERLPIPWLLGIAKKKIQKWQSKKIQERYRIMPVAEISRIRKITQRSDSDVMAEDEIFGLLQGSGSSDPYHKLVLEELLSLVGVHHRQILQLVYVKGLQGQELAAALGITVNNAHVRLSRARNALRQALQTNEQPSKEGN